MVDSKAAVPGLAFARAAKTESGQMMTLTLWCQRMEKMMTSSRGVEAAIGHGWVVETEPHRRQRQDGEKASATVQHRMHCQRGVAMSKTMLVKQWKRQE